jgi:hypothetical protein
MLNFSSTNTGQRRAIKNNGIQYIHIAYTIILTIIGKAANRFVKNFFRIIYIGYAQIPHDTFAVAIGF